MQIGAAKAPRLNADEDISGTRTWDRAIHHLQSASVLPNDHGAHWLVPHSFNPEMAMPWMKDRCRKKKSRTMGSVPMAATAMSWSHAVPKLLMKSEMPRGSVRSESLVTMMRGQMYMSHASRNVNTPRAASAGLQRGMTIWEEIRNS